MMFLVTILILTLSFTHASFAPGAGKAPGSSVGGKFNPVGSVVDNSCLRPDATGAFPTCNPNEKSRCCLGLNCIKFPDGKHRCGGKYSSPYLTMSSLALNTTEFKSEMKDTNSVPGGKPAGMLPFDWGSLMPGGSKANGQGIDGGQFGPGGPNGGRFSPVGKDTVVGAKNPAVGFVQEDSQSEPTLPWLDALSNALGQQSDRKESHTALRDGASQTPAWQFQVTSWVLFAGLCTAFLAIRFKSRSVVGHAFRRWPSPRSVDSGGSSSVRTTYDSL